MTLYKGRAWVYPANVTTDEILPGRFLDRANDEVGQFAMAGIDPEFTHKVKPGDFIVAGPNFGAGSGRETAPIAIQLAGVAAVIAPSFARIFFRNSISVGMPAIIIESVDSIQEQDQLRVDLEQHTVTNLRDGKTHSILNLSGTSLEILRHGGIVPYTKKRISRKHDVEKSP